MRRRPEVLLLLLLQLAAVVAGAATGATTGATPGTSPGATPEEDIYLPATLVRVVDGDTLVVRLQSGLLKVRLHGIDAPERKQRFGAAATKELRSLIEGPALELVPIEQRDSYGRMIAKVYIADRDINAAMIGSGYAWAYRRYLRRDARDEEYCRLEARARADRRGVWSDPPAEWQPPWNWRAAERGQAVTAHDYAHETAAQCQAAIGHHDGHGTHGGTTSRSPDGH